MSLVVIDPEDGIRMDNERLISDIIIKIKHSAGICFYEVPR